MLAEGGSDPVALSCPICGRPFHQESALDRHVNTCLRRKQLGISPDTSRRCPVCSAEFGTYIAQSEIERHVEQCLRSSKPDTHNKATTILSDMQTATSSQHSGNISEKNSKPARAVKRENCTTPATKRDSQSTSLGGRGQLELLQPEVEENTLGSADLNDGLCFVCGEGGNLLLCDGRCYRSFHAACLGIAAQPPNNEDWLCPECIRGIHQCFVCRRWGIDGLSLHQCKHPHCGIMFHIGCVAPVPVNQFRCPRHICEVCAETTSVNDSGICLRCTRSAHWDCIPKADGNFAVSNSATERSFICGAEIKNFTSQKTMPVTVFPATGSVCVSRHGKWYAVNRVKRAHNQVVVQSLCNDEEQTLLATDVLALPTIKSADQLESLLPYALFCCLDMVALASNVHLKDNLSHVYSFCKEQVLGQLKAAIARWERKPADFEAALQQLCELWKVKKGLEKNICVPLMDLSFVIGDYINISARGAPSIRSMHHTNGDETLKMPRKRCRIDAGAVADEALDDNGEGQGRDIPRGAHPTPVRETPDGPNHSFLEISALQVFRNSQSQCQKDRRMKIVPITPFFRSPADVEPWTDERQFLVHVLASQKKRELRCIVPAEDLAAIFEDLRQKSIQDNVKLKQQPPITTSTDLCLYLDLMSISCFRTLQNVVSAQLGMLYMDNIDSLNSGNDGCKISLGSLSGQFSMTYKAASIISEAKSILREIDMEMNWLIFCAEVDYLVIRSTRLLTLR